MSETKTPYFFLLPGLAVTAIVILFPILQTIWLSLHDFILYDPDASTFIGFGNFIKIFNDEVFWISFWRSLAWIVLAVGLQFLLGFATALLLNESFWWRGLARALIVIPWALPGVIIGLMWSWIYDFNTGVLNDGLLRLGLIDAPIAWLAQPETAFYAIVLTLIWQGFPFFAVTILAGLQTIPQELYEAADIDGASRLMRLRHVILPGIAEVIATALLLRVIWVANSLDVILVMTGGGPGYATHTLPLYSFLKAYSSMEFGYGAALALVLSALLLVIVWAYVRRASRSLDR